MPSANLVPQSRPDVCHFSLSRSLPVRRTDLQQIYQALLNIPASPPPPLFEVQFGLLLRKELHHAWDRLDFSFFVKVRFITDMVKWGRKQLIVSLGRRYICTRLHWRLL